MPKKANSSGITQRSDGRFVSTVTDPRTGKRVYIYGKTEREIKKKMLTYTQKATKGRTFKEVADEWWEMTEVSIAWNTRCGYKTAYERAVNHFGSEYINVITAPDINAYITRFAGKGANAKAKKTVTNQLLIIRLIFKHAVSEGDITINPAMSVEVPNNLKSTKRKAASKEEEDIIKMTADVWLLPYFILYTGLRKGEALALTGADIDLKNRIIKVTKSVYHRNNKAFVKMPKTEAGKRVVPILDPLLPYLPTDLKNDEYLFCSARDPKKPMGNELYDSRIIAYHKATGTTVTAHQLRHSYATMLYECGIDAKTAQYLLGHANISTTLDIYTDFRDTVLISAVKSLNEKLAKNEVSNYADNNCCQDVVTNE